MNTKEQYVVATALAGFTIGLLGRYTVNLRKQNKDLNRRIKTLELKVSSKQSYIEHLKTRYKYV